MKRTKDRVNCTRLKSHASDWDLESMEWIPADGPLASGAGVSASANYTEVEPSEEDDEKDGLFVPSARTEHWLLQRRQAVSNLATDGAESAVLGWDAEPQSPPTSFCWTIWLSRNEVVFDKCKPRTLLQVLFRERSGSGSGRRYSALRKTRRCCGKFANYLKGQLSKSSLPLDGYRQVV